jgi:5-methylcytosine-specific restriction endonuclease McrA
LKAQRTDAHRHYPAATNQAGVYLEGVLYTVCKWCKEPIKKSDGSPSLRRLWHPDCVDQYLVRRSSRLLRQVVFKRDRGKCAGWPPASCSKECAVEVGYAESHVTVANRRYLRHGYRNIGRHYWKEIHAWDADHVIPLKDGGGFELENVVTLCAECHKRKTAQENSERARKRRPKDQLPLF